MTASTNRGQLVPFPVSPSAVPQFTPPRLGERVTSTLTGHTYRFGAVIGEGAFGIVYQCEDIWGNELAAKTLKFLPDLYASARNRATSEFRKLVEMRHPFITYVWDAFEFRNTCYIITERCATNLAQLLTLPKPFHGHLWFRPIARCLLQGVNFIHLNGYAHRDIHLGNVFAAFSRNEMKPEAIEGLTFKLGDLGIATLIDEMSASTTALAPWATPPEFHSQANFGPLDHRADIYQAALVLLQIYLGREINFSVQDIIAAHPRRLAEELPTPIGPALGKALRRRVEFRTSGALQLWHELNGW